MSMPFNLDDLIDIEVLRELAESLWKSSGLPTKIVDPAGQVLVSSGSQSLCLLFHRRHPVSLKLCIESDTGIEELLQARTDGHPLETRCLNGLNHIGLPIVVAGQHLATLFFSQFLYETPDEDVFRQRARDLGLDEEAYLDALSEVPVLDRARVREVVAFYDVLVRLLTGMGSREAELLESRARLEQSERKFRSVIESTPLGVLLYHLEADDRLLFSGFNPAAESILGISPSKYLGMPIEEAFPPLAATELPERYRAVCRGERWHNQEIRFSQDGTGGTYEVHAFPTGGGRMAVLFSDITERKRQEEELLNRERFEALVARISTRFVGEGASGFDAAVDLALTEIGEFAGVDRSYLFHFREDDERMSNTHEWCAAGVSREKDRLQNVPFCDIPWIVSRILAGEVVHIPRVADLPHEARREKEHLAAQHIRSVLVVPVVSVGRVVGLIGFDAVQTEKTWDERDLTLLRTVGEIIGSGLARRRAEEALEYRARLDQLIAAVSARMVNLEPDTVDGAINDALRELGTLVGVDRCYVFQLSPDAKSMSNTHEWCARGIQTFREELQEMPADALPWFLDRIRREPIYVPDVANLGPEAEAEKTEWQREGIRSLLCVPISFENRLLGFIGFDAVCRPKSWADEIILLLRVVGECFANALERRRNDRARREREALLQKLLQETEEARTRMAAILRCMPVGVLLTEIGERIALANGPAREMLKLPAEGWQTTPLASIPLVPLQEQIRVVLAGGEAGPAEWEISNGREPRVIQARTDLVLDTEGCGTGAITLLQDITREREIDRMKNEFISTAAHELRTPLASVMGYTELLLNQTKFGTFSADEQRGFLEEVHARAENLAQIVNDLLNLSRVESGQIVQLEPADEKVEPLLQEVVSDFALLHPSHRFELTVSGELPEIFIDRGKIRQVLENLIGNAVKFSPESTTVRVGGRLIEGGVEIKVQDEGIGMTEEQVAHIFDKFYRADASNTALAGLGLGMTIVKNIIEPHGGSIQVESFPGIGTIVRFALPTKAIQSTGSAKCKDALGVRNS